jgi:hypothetical protein
MRWYFSAMAVVAIHQGPAGHATEWPNGARAAIVLTYDDAIPSQLENAIPALDAAGLKGTFFLSNVRRVDVERWKAAAASGHELANHTLNHPCLAGTFEMPPRQQLEQYTPEAVLQEIGQQNVLLTALDGLHEHGFAVPCGQTVAGGRDYLAPLRRSGLVAYSRSVDQSDADLQRDPSTLDPFKLPGRAFASPADAEQMIGFAEMAAKGVVWRSMSSTESAAIIFRSLQAIIAAWSIGWPRTARPTGLQRCAMS